jgi:hypothetical protein
MFSLRAYVNRHCIYSGQEALNCVQHCEPLHTSEVGGSTVARPPRVCPDKHVSAVQRAERLISRLPLSSGEHNLCNLLSMLNFLNFLNLLTHSALCLICPYQWLRSDGLYTTLKTVTLFGLGKLLRKSAGV